MSSCFSSCLMILHCRFVSVKLNNSSGVCWTDCECVCWMVCFHCFFACLEKMSVEMGILNLAVSLFIPEVFLICKDWKSRTKLCSYRLSVPFFLLAGAHSNVSSSRVNILPQLLTFLLKWFPPDGACVFHCGLFLCPRWSSFEICFLLLLVSLTVSAPVACFHVTAGNLERFWVTSCTATTFRWPMWGAACVPAHFSSSPLLLQTKIWSFSIFCLSKMA